MVKHSPHKRWKGHCALCSHWNGKSRNEGLAARTPWPVLRKLGKKRRVSRRDLGD